MAELALHRLRKEYRGVPVVHDISFTLPSGKLLTLLGPSGCGKSTTLRMIAGLTPADAGRVQIGGRDVTDARSRDRDISMVFQSLALFPHMTAAENIAFPLRVQRVPKAERAARVAQALDLIRMAGFAGRYPDQLSGGQRQRVALARAIVSNPAVLLLDEPFSALDRKLRGEMQEELRALVARLGMTTVFVTHDQEEAIRISDYVAVMHEGRIDQFAAPETVYNHPGTRFVADFMGATNVADGVVTAVDAHRVRVCIGGTDVTAARPVDTEIEAGTTVTLTVRPERTSLVTVAPDNPTGLRARVTGRVFEGAFTTSTVTLVALPDRAWTVRTPSAQSDGPVPGPGDEVWVTWPDRAGQLVLR